MKRIREFVNPKDFRMNYFLDKLHIVNYSEIVLLTEEKMIIKKDNKMISVNGKDLALLKLLDDEILIGGSIKSIEL